MDLKQEIKYFKKLGKRWTRHPALKHALKVIESVHEFDENVDEILGKQFVSPKDCSELNLNLYKAVLELQEDVNKRALHIGRSFEIIRKKLDDFERRIEKIEKKS